MKIEYHVIPFTAILQHWVKDYQVPIANYEAFIDPNKQVVVFQLYVDESKVTSAPDAPKSDAN